MNSAEKRAYQVWILTDDKCSWTKRLMAYGFVKATVIGEMGQIQHR